MNASFTQWDLALAARALKFAKSVPLRLGVTRVPRTCYGFCVRGMGGDYPLGALKRRWLRSGVLRSPLGPWYALTGSGGAFRAQICTPVQITYLWPRGRRPWSLTTSRTTRCPW